MTRARTAVLTNAFLFRTNPILHTTALRLPTTTRLSSTTSSALSGTSFPSKTQRLFDEDINIIYDGRCNVCKLEIDFLSRRDTTKINIGQPRLKMTDLEDSYDPSDPANGGIDYGTGMAAIHAVTAEGKVVKGVPVFALAYEKVGLGWVFRITKWPVVRKIVDVAYVIFAKYRTNLTRGASIDVLVREYEQKRALEQKMQEGNCVACSTIRSS